MSLTKVSYSMINGAAVNVLDFGADPTGVADSTNAFVNAMLSFPAYPSGGTIWVPNGTYKITQFWIRAGITIIGESKAEVVIIPYNTSGEYAIGMDDIYTRLENLTIDGSNSVGYGLRIKGVKSKSVQHVIVNNFKVDPSVPFNSLNGVGVLLEATYGVSVRDCEITGNNVNVLMRGGEVNEIIFDNCTIEFSDSYGVLMDKGIGVKFLNCSFGHHGGSPWLGTAIKVTFADATVSIDTCWFEYCLKSLEFAGAHCVATNNHSAGAWYFTAGLATVTDTDLYGYGSEITLPVGSTAIVSVMNNRNASLGINPYLDETGGLRRIGQLKQSFFAATLSPETSGTITVVGATDSISQVANNFNVTLNGRLTINSVSSPVGSYVAIQGLNYPCFNLFEEADWTAGSCIYTKASTGVSTVVPAYIYGGLSEIRIVIDASTLAASDYFVLGITYPILGNPVY